MEKLFFKWSELKATFWFVPVIIIIFSILLSVSLVYVDSRIDFSQDGLGRYFFVKSPNSARTILSTISAAMMGVAGTVFSITLVVLTLASSQFGPRLIKNFMYVRLNQVVLGSYVSTYLYCLLVLIAVKEDNDYTFIPTISILVAIVAAIVNILLLIVFIHHIAISLQADKVISDISDFISKQVKTLFPEKMGNTAGSEKSIDISAATLGYRQHIYIKSPKSGYIQYIDSESLMEIITQNDSLLELYHRPGGHLVEGGEIGLLYSNEQWDKEGLETISNQLEIGKIKTSQQDIEFSILQIVEIASRALSPGINDPFTAITCIDNLSATMCALAQAQFPEKYRFDEAGTLRIIAHTLAFEGLLDSAFNQIRQYSGGSPAVMIRLMEALTTLSKFTTHEKHKNAVRRHAEMVLNMGKETIKEKNDLRDLTNRSKEIFGG